MIGDRLFRAGVRRVQTHSRRNYVVLKIIKSPTADYHKQHLYSALASSLQSSVRQSSQVQTHVR